MITVLLITFPFLAGILLLLLKGEAVKQVALALSLAVLGLALSAWAQFDISSGGVQFQYIQPWVASAGINFSVGMDGISLLLVLLTTFLVPFIVLSTFRQNQPNPSAFYGLMLLMEAGLLGVFLAQDAVLFYLFWEAALIPVYFLAGIWGSERRIKVTFKFFIYTIFGSLFMLVAFAYLYLSTPGSHSSALNDIYAAGRSLDGPTQGLIFWALFLAFAIKMPVFPFHTWQPDTYTESPAAATMLLSGIMLKMGIYGTMRWLLPVVPNGVAFYGNTAIILAVIGIVYGSLIAIKQKDIKRLIAYSSFAHVGLMAAGVFTLSNSGLQGAMIQMLAHGINVVGLFAVIDFVQKRTQSRLLEKLGGITQSSTTLTVYFLILLLGSVALPLTSGFVGEFLLLKGVFDYNFALGAVAGLTIIFGAVYMLRMFQGVMFGQKSELTIKFEDLAFSEKATLFPLAFMVFWIGLYPASFLTLTAPAVAELVKIIKL